ncbi:hypothetical protein F5B17DRAFT_395806, partial [Nemania serpens]
MDVGTILAIIQLSASVFKLGREISNEFFSGRAPERLRHLNTRLQILNEYLEKVYEQHRSATKLLATKFTGSDSIEKTLKECKTFLEGYKSLLSETRSRGSSAAQRVLLVVGPDAERIDEFHKRIDQHHTELAQWRMEGIAGKLDGIQRLIEQRLPPTTGDLPLQPRNSVLDPIFEFPPAAPPYQSRPNSEYGSRASRSSLISQHLPDYDTESTANRNNQPVPSYENASTATRNNWNSQTVLSHESGSTAARNNSWNGSDSSTRLAQTISSLNLSLPGHYVTMLLGIREGLHFSLDAYRVHMNDKGRIVDWSSPRIKVRHILPPGSKQIPYTKPNNAKNEVTFLPHDSEHRLEITTPENGVKTIKDRVRYQFSHKADRDIFQRQIRSRQTLHLIQVVQIHTSSEKNVAMHAHLKVWSRNEHDMEPTFSFPYLGKNEPNHQHVEYKIRWFRKEPERRTDTRLKLYPYSEDADLSYGPAVEDANKKSQPVRNIIRRMSGSSYAASTSHSPSASSGSAVLYDWKGKPPPEDFKLRYLEFEFQSSSLREKFVSACYEAHHRTSRRPASVSEIGSLSPNTASLFSQCSPSMSQTTTPQRSISELDCVSPVAEMGWPGPEPAPAPREGYSPSLPPLPSPAIPRTTPIQFHNLNPFQLPDPAIPTTYELEAGEPPPHIDPGVRGPQY